MSQAPAIELFGTLRSPFVEKVRRTLGWKKLAYRHIESGAEARRLNPQTGKIPVLRLDGEVLHDSTRIAQRLDESFPDPALFSADPVVAARQRLLEDWSDESLYWHFLALSSAPRARRETFEATRAALPRWLRFATPLVVRRWRRTAWAQGIARLPDPLVLEALGRHLDDLCQLVHPNGYLAADQPSLADFAVFGQVEAAGRTATRDYVADLLAPRPALTAYLDRVRAVSPPSERSATA